MVVCFLFVFIVVVFCSCWVFCGGGGFVVIFGGFWVVFFPFCGCLGVFFCNFYFICCCCFFVLLLMVFFGCVCFCLFNFICFGFCLFSVSDSATEDYNFTTHLVFPQQACCPIAVLPSHPRVTLKSARTDGCKNGRTETQIR